MLLALQGLAMAKGYSGEALLYICKVIEREKHSVQRDLPLSYFYFVEQGRPVLALDVR
jgi:hypothetical protein